MALCFNPHFQQTQFETNGNLSADEPKFYQSNKLFLQFCFFYLEFTFLTPFPPENQQCYSPEEGCGFLHFQFLFSPPPTIFFGGGGLEDFNMAVNVSLVRDTKWLTLEVCREFQRGTCSRSDTECKFAHPSRSCHVENGRVIACFDSLKVSIAFTPASVDALFASLWFDCQEESRLPFPPVALGKGCNSAVACTLPRGLKLLLQFLASPLKRVSDRKAGQGRCLVPASWSGCQSKQMVLCIRLGKNMNENFMGFMTVAHCIIKC